MVSLKVTSILAGFLVTKTAGASPDCTAKENLSKPVCICRNPISWFDNVCQGWLEHKNRFDTDHEIKIINGVQVAANTYPWFARSQYAGSGFPYDWGGCGGSLVSPEYVLSAAHCFARDVSGSESNGSFQIGALCSPYGPSSSSNCQQAVEKIGIRKIYQHPSYNDVTTANDFSLIRLDSSSSITPVNMDFNNVSDGYESLSSKGNLWPIGFGTMEDGSMADRLMHVNVNYVKQSSCNSAYSGAILDNMMCAADTNQDSCQGDSGGPLYDSENNVLVGVVSWGYGCADARYPGVYSRISNQISWIQTTICTNHNDPKPSYCSGTPTPPTPTPPSPTPRTPPTCVDSFEGWHDADGPAYDCDWYALDDHCEKYGDMFENLGYTANEACCVCGGGDIGGPTPDPPSPTPPSPTPPTCVDSYEGWHDADGEEYDCEWYAINNKCEQVGDFFENFGYTANEACCACGGGDTGGPTPNPPTPTPPSPTPTCDDSYEDWHDADGEQYDCDWYAQGDNCQQFGDMFENNGYTANEACCVCGGGNTGGPSPNPPSPTPPTPTPPTPTPPTPTPPTCVDDPSGWYDADGAIFDCDWYAEGENCFLYGDLYENFGATANEACCACGGGSSGPSPTPPMTQTPTPPTPTTLPPSPTPPTPTTPPPSPTTPTPPTAPETNPPTPSPTTASICVDSQLKFLVNGKNRFCSWVAQSNTPLRCSKGNGAVSTHCPETCGTCSEHQCEDAQKRFRLTNGNLKSCTWVARTQTSARCAKEGVALTCRATCSNAMCPN